MNSFFFFPSSPFRFAPRTKAKAEDVNARLDEVSYGFDLVSISIADILVAVGSTASAAASAATAAAASAAAQGFAAVAQAVSPDSPVRMNSRSISAALTIPSAYNAASVGPIAIAEGISATVSDNATWSIQ